MAERRAIGGKTKYAARASTDWNYYNKWILATFEADSHKMVIWLSNYHLRAKRLLSLSLPLRSTRRTVCGYYEVCGCVPIDCERRAFIFFGWMSSVTPNTHKIKRKCFIVLLVLGILCGSRLRVDVNKKSIVHHMWRWSIRFEFSSFSSVVVSVVSTFTSYGVHLGAIRIEWKCILQKYKRKGNKSQRYDFQQIDACTTTRFWSNMLIMQLNS